MRNEFKIKVCLNRELNTSVFEVMESEISLLDKTATTSGPRTLVGLIRIMG
jgi:hypothetical protein